MKISDALSALNYDRNQMWKLPFSPENAKQAIYSFTGEVFRGIDIHTLEAEKIPILQDQLRILSGLYGILKPLDLIQPYRLEMGTRIKVGRKENLYKFWDDTVANALNEDLGIFGDITSQAIIDPEQSSIATIVLKQDAVLCGIDFAIGAFKQLDKKTKILISLHNISYVLLSVL